MSDEVVNTTESLQPGAVEPAPLVDVPAAAVPAEPLPDQQPEAVTSAPEPLVDEPPVVEAAPEAEAPRDETPDSVDPQTGTLTQGALDRRDDLMEALRELGHKIQSWEQALGLMRRDDGTLAHPSEVPAPATAQAAQ